MATSVWDRIEAARERHDVLQHPFYTRWSAGELTGDELARYSGQYRHAVDRDRRAVRRGRRRAPGASRPGRARREERAHVELWDGFVEPRSAAAPTRRPPPRPPHCVEVWTERDGALAGPRPPLRDRERPAGDLEDEARGPRRPLRRRRRRRDPLLHGPPRSRRRACGRAGRELLEELISSRRGRGRRRRRRRARLRGQLAPARRRLRTDRPRRARSTSGASPVVAVYRSRRGSGHHSLPARRRMPPSLRFHVPARGRDRGLGRIVALAPLLLLVLPILATGRAPGSSARANPCGASTAGRDGRPGDRPEAGRPSHRLQPQHPACSTRGRSPGAARRCSA